MHTISLNDMYTLSTAQLVWVSKSLGIVCYADCIDHTNKSLFKIYSLPKLVLCQRLLDYFNNGIVLNEPIRINMCHYAPYMSRSDITFSLNDYVLINRFSTDNWNCRAFLRKCGINATYQQINDFVFTQWIANNKPFTYRDMQIMFVNYIAQQMHITTPTDSTQHNLRNTCNKILQHSYIPTINLILQTLSN